MPLNQTLARPRTAPELEIRAAVERATLLLVHAMQETDAPVADLGAALARMAATLNEPASDVETLRAVLARDIGLCVESLQSYDRLMQQLAQAREILTELARTTHAPADDQRREGTVELF